MPDDTQQSVQVSGFGKGIKITGPSAFLSALVLGLLAVLAYLVNYNVKSWGEPFPIKQAFIEQESKIDDHTQKMSVQHNDITLAIRWNTFVQWACSPNNISDGAKKKCSQIDLMEPES